MKRRFLPPIYSNLLFALTLGFFLLSGCTEGVIESSATSSNNNDNTTQTDVWRGGTAQWIIESEEIIDGGPGKDGIPSIDDPNYAFGYNIDFIPDDRMVVGIHEQGDVRAYPHQILDWHEIVNTEIAGRSYSLLFCPLTGTATAWNHNSPKNRMSEFGTSGLLYRNNLIAYDRDTDTHWSQMQLRGVKGSYGAFNIETYQVVETTWKTWKKMYPTAKVLTTETGFNRTYDLYAYGSTYPTNHASIHFPRTHTDDRLQNKVRVHGIIDSETADEDATVKTFPIEDFGNGIRLTTTTIGEHRYLVVGSTDLNFASAFILYEDGDFADLNFEAVENELPVVMEDQEGNKWDVFGYAIEGPKKGMRIPTARSYTGYWFAWADFFPGLEIHEWE